MNKFFIILSIVIISLTANAKLYKISPRGDVLKNNAQDFICILDDKSKLIWEVKTNNKGLQNTANTYTWFDGKTGVENGDYSHNCNWGNNCNTRAYIKALNASNLCKQSNWRLPSESELKTLLIYGDENPLINTNFFPNTKLKTYWTIDEIDENIAIDVPFFYGGVKSSDKSFDAHIRAVANVAN